MRAVGMIPASGWNAVFETDGTEARDPVIAWVLLEGETRDGETYRSFTGVTVMGDGPMEAEDVSNHKGYEPIGGWDKDR